MGLRRTLTRRGVRGIINGLDTSAWNPATDPLLTASMRFSPATAPQGKAAAKAWLQEHCGLPRVPHAPVVAFLGRLTDQKGVDLLLKAVCRAVGPDVLAREAAERCICGPSNSARVRSPDFSVFRCLCEAYRERWGTGRPLYPPLGRTIWKLAPAMKGHELCPLSRCAAGEERAAAQLVLFIQC